jgi:RNA polymerase sigma-70 factor (ECF subfamily)
MRKSSPARSGRRTGPAPVGGTKPAETAAQPLEGLGVDTGDARLVERARGGDDAAFGVLVARYERKLLRVLTRLVRDGELARDLAQETFWRVYNRLDRFDTARRFGPWLFRVGVNLGLDWLRRHDPATAAPLSIDRSPGDGLPAFDLPDPDPRLQADLAQEVQFVLARIPVTYRTILVLRDLEGFSSAEVAAIVSRREATIRWRLARAREMFRDQWERRQGATSWSSRPSRCEGDRS